MNNPRAFSLPVTNSSRNILPTVTDVQTSVAALIRIKPSLEEETCRAVLTKKIDNAIASLIKGDVFSASITVDEAIAFVAAVA